jgi:hypothetical protein
MLSASLIASADLPDAVGPIKNIAGGRDWVDIVKNYLDVLIELMIEGILIVRT